MAQYVTPAFLQAIDSSGSPYSGALLYIYATGTTTALSLYSNSGLTTATANPMVADASGRFSATYCAETSFKAVLKTSAGVEIKSADPVYSIGASDAADAEDVAFDGDDIGFSSDNVQDAIEEVFAAIGEPGTISSSSAGTLLTITSTEAGATSGPDLELYRNSASPAISDILGSLLFYGEDSAGNKELYAAIRAVIVDRTSASEDADLVVRTVVAGTVADRWHFRIGFYADTATGTDQGTGTINAKAVYDDGVRLGTGVPDFILEDQKAQNTDGGTFTSGAWQTRTLNTEVRDDGGIVSISSNEFTPTVNGWVYWEAPALKVDNHQSRLYNVTDTAVAGTGTSMFAANSGDGNNFSTGWAAVTAAKAYRIEHQCATTRNTDGFGQASDFGTEVYARVLFWRVLA